jgi:Vps53-like, N-terminal
MECMSAEYRIKFEFSEASLSGVEPLMQKIQSEIRRVDASILAAVRQQVSFFFCLLLNRLLLPWFLKFTSKFNNYK